MKVRCTQITVVSFWQTRSDSEPATVWQTSMDLSSVVVRSVKQDRGLALIQSRRMDCATPFQVSSTARQFGSRCQDRGEQPQKELSDRRPAVAEPSLTGHLCQHVAGGRAEARVYVATRGVCDLNCPVSNRHHLLESLGAPALHCVQLAQVPQAVLPHHRGSRPTTLSIPA
jgi:hypothetical protein